jgi:GLPGLI family protein
MFKIIFLMSLAFVNKSISQTIDSGSHYVYEVKRAIYSPNVSGINKRAEVLKYQGHIYSQNMKSIYFEKPLYLEKYPNGEIVTYYKDNERGILDICIDSLQYINYFDLETNARITRTNVGKFLGYNYVDTVRIINNVYLPQNEQKEINGLKCQKFIVGQPADPDWTLWICLDIPLQFNFIYPYSPGLIVEGYNKDNNIEMRLVNYNLNENIKDIIFKPRQFDEPIRKRKKL